ncbi:MAG: hypothetical protein QM817_26245 [Archangium sp.]
MRTSTFVAVAVMMLAACKSGDPGPQGPQGERGPAGPAGMNGAAGPAGASVTTGEVDAGSVNCPFGGVAVVSASGTTFVCNGAPGTTGPAGTNGVQGAAGPQGVPGSSISASALSAMSPQCPSGGVLVNLADGGTLPVCNGTNGRDGDAGANGVDGVSVTLRALSPGDTTCPTGGVEVIAATSSTKICNGAPGAQGDAGPQGAQGVQGVQGPPGPQGPSSLANCPTGMTRIDSAFSTLCFARSSSPQNWDGAAAFCSNNFAAPLCTLSQWRAAVCIGGAPNPGRSWLATPTATSTFMTVASCLSDGVAPLSASSQFSPVCCLEWPRY